MTPAEAASILRAHNRWRRADYDDTADMESPRVIGEAMDVLIEFAEQHAPGPAAP